MIHDSSFVVFCSDWVQENFTHIFRIDFPVSMFIPQIDRLVHERRNSIANALELYLSFINPSKWPVESNAWFRTFALIVIMGIQPFPTTPSRGTRAWWRHKMEIFSALLALCAGNSPVICEFPSQRPVTRNFYGFFHLHPKKRLSKTVS